MRFDTSQHMKLGQQLKLAPRVIQSMEILQMPLTELEERIEQELENNVTLELAEGDPEADETGERTDREEREASQDGEITVDDSGEADFERLESFEEANPDAAENEYSASALRDRAGPDEFDTGRPTTRLDGERDAKADAMASTPAREASLTDQLLNQWALADVEEALRPLGEAIIAHLDDDGYLRTDLESIRDKVFPPGTGGGVGSSQNGAGVSGSSSGVQPGADQQTDAHTDHQRGGLDGDGRPPVSAFERALAAVQLFLEPPGVAARDARECLLLQIDAFEEESHWDPDDDKQDLLGVARTLVEDHLDDLMQNRLPRIAERTGMDLERIKAGLQVLRRLSLAPGRRLVTERPQPITPDAIVEYDEEQDRYVAYLNDRSVPQLRINREYARMSRDRSVEKKDRDFIRTNLSNAQWLIDAVEQRRHTLLRVISVVVDAQREYFDYGPQSLRPLPMTQVAEQLGVHVATVSRAVADKHLMTPRGVVPLRRFFSGGTQTESGEEMSWDSIKAALQEVIDGEDKKSPLSDEALAEALRERGIDIARRTVAKYRGQLGIQSARLRKAY